jgi:hypothetical protein
VARRDVKNLLEQHQKVDGTGQGWHRAKLNCAHGAGGRGNVQIAARVKSPQCVARVAFARSRCVRVRLRVNFGGK